MLSLSRRFVLSLLICLFALSSQDAVSQSPQPSRGEPYNLLRSAKRIVFLGDSITASGGYASYFDAWLRLQNFDPPPVLINVGLASETVSGLSEQGHAGGKFPRPDLFERLDRVLAVTKPDLVFACYGINCGIYQPFDEERFAKYQQGIERLKQKVEAIGAKLIVITPPFYDGKRKPGQFSYNEVLDRYTAWLNSQGEQRGASQGWHVVDLHTAMTNAVAARREADPKFTFQPDGVHPNDAGHWFMAQQLIRWFGEDSLKNDVDAQTMLAAYAATFPALNSEPNRKAYLDLTKKRAGVLHAAYLSAAGHKRPGVAAGLPIDEAEQKYREYTAELNKLLTDGSSKP